MEVLKDIDSFLKYRNSIPANQGIAFVPTMGALHEGHATLLRTAADEHPVRILSIFVNPTQFGANEDLSKYPRTLESDLEIARACGVSAVFYPTEAMMYPDGYSTFVTEENLSKVLCGIYRPVHFRGVTTIVLKLLNLVRPTESFFGLKDAQQFLVIQKMVRDLNLQTKITGIETVREETGLALSSRNRYLPEQLRLSIAPLIYQELCMARDAIRDRGLPVSQAEAESCERLQDAGFQIQYFETRAIPNLDRVVHYKGQNCMIAVAGLLNGTRLIDNVWF